MHHNDQHSRNTAIQNVHNHIHAVQPVTFRQLRRWIIDQLVGYDHAEDATELIYDAIEHRDSVFTIDDEHVIDYADNVVLPGE